MPLVRVDALEGRSENDIKCLLDAVHRAVLSAFKVRQRDRYQIYRGAPRIQFASLKIPAWGFSEQKML